MANKNVEGVWIVTGVFKLGPCGMTERLGNDEVRCKSRVATTQQGLKAAIRAAKRWTSGIIRVEVEHYPVGPVETYNAEID